MKLEFQPKALEDLMSIQSYIALDNIERANSFVDELIDACEHLLEHPDRSQALLRIDGHPIRRQPFGAYAIYYTVGETTTSILRVVNSAMDQRNVFG